MPRPELSIVLPCYKAASIALESVERLTHHLAQSGRTWEIIVVDDGGRDISQNAFEEFAEVRVIRLDQNSGKGAAVKEGMLAARGDVRVFTDVDLPYDLDLIETIAEAIRERGVHLVIGDRSLPSSRYASETSIGRAVASSLFTAFVGTLVTGGFFDTQCGLKGMRGDIADELFRLVRLQRFAFDVELIYIALKSRLDIYRIPVQLRNNRTSSVRLWRDSTRGVVDVFRIKWNQLHGHYRSQALESIVQREFDDLRVRAKSSAPLHVLSQRNDVVAQ